MSLASGRSPVPGASKLGFRVFTLGCKVNQFDAASLSLALEEAGLRGMDQGEPPGLIVVQTCSVTSAADRQNRQLIRKLRAEHPQAVIVATGCQAQALPESLERMPELDLVWKEPQKEGLLKRLLPLLGLQRGWQVPPRGLLWGEGLMGLPGRTRGFLKVQDGCNGGCSYCIVPKARGPSRSRPMESVLRALQRWEEAGIREAVLAGIHLGAYGRDLEPPCSLRDLLDSVLGRCSIPRIRLSSIEPQELEDGIIQQMAENPRLCHHLHVPLQSGHDEILKLMNRPYDTHLVEDRIRTAVSRVPDITLGMDVMVGFPGESREHFQQSLAFIERLPWTYLHVFPFSPRPGTEAEGMKPIVPPKEKRERAQLLRELSSNRIRARMASCVGDTTEVLLEGPLKGMSGWMEGRTGTYLRVAIRAGEELANSIVTVKLEDLRQGILVGTMVGLKIGVDSQAGNL